MYLLSNPVLQRELLVNLRRPRAFGLLLLYQLLLSLIVYFAWPTGNIRIDLSDTQTSSSLINLVFLGQYLLASLMAPSFAAGAIAGEKERTTYEMLLASPIRPEAIVMGKLVAALTHLTILVFASLPIVMLCLPLGGFSLWEVLAAYAVLFSSVISFGMISVASGSYFPRTSSALVVSYLTILPLAMLGVMFWYLTADAGLLRLEVSLTVIPGLAIALTCVLFYLCSARMLYPPDFGSEGKQVVDLEQENERAIGVIIERDQFPDRLFAPPVRTTLMDDGINPVYDKEMRSEIFGQGTLMLRLAIQISMLLAIPLMAFCVYIYQHLAAWYIAYVLLFNVLIGPVFSAGSITSERERQTLDLLLTTIITPWQLLWGKFLAGLRVSSVLSSFLLWPLMLSLMFTLFWETFPTILGYLIIFGLTCLSTATLALLCSTLFQTTSASLMATYTVILLLYGAPIAANLFAQTYYPASSLTPVVAASTVTSPFAAAFELPLYVENFSQQAPRWSPADPSEPQLWGYPLRDLRHFAGYVAFTVVLNLVSFSLMIVIFNRRWRVASK